MTPAFSEQRSAAMGQLCPRVDRLLGGVGLVLVGFLARFIIADRKASGPKTWFSETTKFDLYTVGDQFP